MTSNLLHSSHSLHSPQPSHPDEQVVGTCPFCGQAVTQLEFGKAVYACENVAEDTQAEDIAIAFGLLGHPVQIGNWAAIGPFCSRCVGKAIRGTLVRHLDQPPY